MPVPAKQQHNPTRRPQKLGLALAIATLFAVPSSQALDTNLLQLIGNTSLDVTISQPAIGIPDPRPNTGHGVAAGIRFGDHNQTLYFGAGSVQTRPDGSQVPLTATNAMDYQFRIGSVTKTYAAAAVLQMVDQGRFGLDQYIAQLMPELNIYRGDEISVRDLLMMRSGLREYLRLPDPNDPDGRGLGEMWLVTEGQTVYSAEELIRMANNYARQNDLDFNPGTRMGYSNTNYAILGLLAEKFDPNRRSIADIINQEVLAAIGANQNTLYPVTNRDILNGLHLAEGYGIIPPNRIGPERDNLGNFTYPDLTVPGAAGAMLASVDGQLLWAETMATNRGGLLSPGLHEQRLQAPADGALSGFIPVEYGMGILTGTLPSTGDSMVGHGGTLNGGTTQVFWLPEHNMGFSVNFSQFPVFFPKNLPYHYMGLRDILPVEDPDNGALFSFYMLQRNIMLAMEAAGGCMDGANSSIAAGGSLNCSGDSIRTASIRMADNASFTVQDSGRTITSYTLVDENYTPSLELTESRRPTLSFYGHDLRAVEGQGNNLNIAVQRHGILDVTGDRSVAVHLDGNASRVQVDGSVGAYGNDARALHASGRGHQVNVSDTGMLYGDVVFNGAEMRMQLDGGVNNGGLTLTPSSDLHLRGAGRFTNGYITLQNNANLDGPVNLASFNNRILLESGSRWTGDLTVGVLGEPGLYGDHVLFTQAPDSVLAGSVTLNSRSSVEGDMRLSGAGQQMQLAPRSRVEGGLTGQDGYQLRGVGTVLGTVQGMHVAPGNLVGAFTLDGRENPTNSIGTLTIGGYVANGTELEMEVGPSGADQLRVTASSTMGLGNGSARLAGGTLNVVALPGARDGLYTAVHADRIIGRFGQIHAPTGRNGFTYAYEPTNRLRVATVSPTLNDAVVRTGQVQMNRQFSALDNRIVGLTLPDPVPSEFQYGAMANDLPSLAARLNETPLEVENSDGSRIWGRGSLTFDRQKSEDQVDGYRQRGSALVGGIDYPLNDETRLGVMLGFDRSSVDVHQRVGDNLKADGFVGGVYATTHQDNFFASVAILGGNRDNATTRNVSMDGQQLPSTADFSTKHIGGRVAVGTQIDMANGTAVRPMAAISYQRVRQGAYTERGSEQGATMLGIPNYELSQGSRSVDNWRTQIGVTVDREYQTDGRRGTTLTIIPEAILGLAHDSEGGSRTAQAQITGFGESFDLTARGARGTSVLGGLGVNIVSSETTSIFLNYETEISNNYTNNALSAGLRYRF